MKPSLKVLAVGFLTMGITNSYAEPRDRMIQERKPTKPEIVTYKGTVNCKGSSHTTEHDHELVFKPEGSDKSYDLENSSELAKLHCQAEKGFVAEITAEKTPQFLFWGGNLELRSFKVLEEVQGDRIAHSAPPKRQTRTFSPSRDR